MGEPAQVGFWAIADSVPERLAIVDAEGHTLAFGELEKRSNRLAHGLRGLGLQRGDGGSNRPAERSELRRAVPGNHADRCLSDRASTTTSPVQRSPTSSTIARRRCSSCTSGTKMRPRWPHPTSRFPSITVSPSARLRASARTQRSRSVSRRHVARSIAGGVDALHLRHDGTTQGGAARIAGRRPPTTPQQSVRCCRCCSTSSPAQGCISWPGRCTTRHAGVRHECAASGSDHGAHGPVDSGRHAAANRAVGRLHQPHGADNVPPPARVSDDVRASADTSTLRSVIHAAAPCPIQVKEQNDRLVGPGDLRVLRRHRGQAAHDAGRHADVADSIPGTVGQPALVRHAADLRRSTGRELPAGEPGTVYMRPTRAARSSTTTIAARRHEPSRRNAAGWTTLGDVGYVDPRGLPVPHRPQGAHDHLRRRQHLSGRDRVRDTCSSTHPEGGSTSP
jgi:long-chain acyl-CoA synthetase